MFAVTVLTNRSSTHLRHRASSSPAAASLPAHASRGQRGQPGLRGSRFRCRMPRCGPRLPTSSSWGKAHAQAQQGRWLLLLLPGTHRKGCPVPSATPWPSPPIPPLPPAAPLLPPNQLPPLLLLWPALPPAPGARPAAAISAARRLMMALLSLTTDPSSSWITGTCAWRGRAGHAV